MSSHLAYQQFSNNIIYFTCDCAMIMEVNEMYKSLFIL